MSLVGSDIYSILLIDSLIIHLSPKPISESVRWIFTTITELYHKNSIDWVCIRTSSTNAWVQVCVTDNIQQEFAFKNFPPNFQKILVHNENMAMVVLIFEWGQEISHSNLTLCLSIFYKDVCDTPSAVNAALVLFNRHPSLTIQKEAMSGVVKSASSPPNMALKACGTHLRSKYQSQSPPLLRCPTAVKIPIDAGQSRKKATTNINPTRTLWSAKRATQRPDFNESFTPRLPSSFRSSSISHRRNGCDGSPINPIDWTELFFKSRPTRLSSMNHVIMVWMIMVTTASPASVLGSWNKRIGWSTFWVEYMPKVCVRKIFLPTSNSGSFCREANKKI